MQDQIYNIRDEGERGVNSQAIHLPRKAPNDTLPMPVADTQKQKKCSRNSECSTKRLAVKTEIKIGQTEREEKD